MAAKKWDCDGHEAVWSDPGNWSAWRWLTFFQKFRFWLAEKLVGRQFDMTIKPKPQEVVFNGTSTKSFTIEGKGWE